MVNDISQGTFSHSKSYVGFSLPWCMLEIFTVSVMEHLRELASLISLVLLLSYRQVSSSLFMQYLLCRRRQRLQVWLLCSIEMIILYLREVWRRQTENHMARSVIYGFFLDRSFGLKGYWMKDHLITGGNVLPSAMDAFTPFITLLNLSIPPLLWGLYRAVRQCLMLRCCKNSLNWKEVKCGPLSVIITSAIPHLVNSSWRVWITVVDITTLVVATSGHLECRSWTLFTKRCDCGVIWNSPAVSIWSCVWGHWGHSIGCMCGCVGLTDFPEIAQASQLWTNCSIWVFMPGHQTASLHLCFIWTGWPSCAIWSTRTWRDSGMTAQDPRATQCWWKLVSSFSAESMALSGWAHSSAIPLLYSCVLAGE